MKDQSVRAYQITDPDDPLRNRENTVLKCKRKILIIIFSGEWLIFRGKRAMTIRSKEKRELIIFFRENGYG